MQEQELQQEVPPPVPPELSEEALAKETAEGPPIFAPSKEAKYPYGVVYKGPYETEYDGVSIAVRRGACAIRRTGVPVFLQSENHMFAKDGIVRRVIYSDLPTSVIQEVDHISELQHRETVLTVRHVVPTKNKLESILYPKEICSESKEFREFFRKSLILYSAWETQTVEKETVYMLNLFGRLWVPCSDNKRWLESSGVPGEKIDVMPHPLAFRDPMRTTERSQLPRPFRILNVSKWEPRKAQHDIIGGFLIAFEPNEDVQLIMKANPFAKFDGYPESPAASVKMWLEDPRVVGNGWTEENIIPRIEIMWPLKGDGTTDAVTHQSRKLVFSRKQMALVYCQCDCYISAGRCEGFDLPAFDAKVMGLRLIAPAFGGPRDFLSDTDVQLGPDPEPELLVHIPHPWYMASPETRWVAHNAMDIAFAMRTAFRMKDSEQEKFPIQDYSIDAVGKRMRASLNGLAAELGFDLAAINVDTTT